MQQRRLPAQRRGPRTPGPDADVVDVVGLLVFTVEDRSAERVQLGADTALEVPGFIVGTVDGVLKFEAAVVHHTEDTGGDVLNVEASLRVVAVAAEEAASRLSVSNCSSELESRELTGVTACDIQ